MDSIPRACALASPQDQKSIFPPLSRLRVRRKRGGFPHKEGANVKGLAFRRAAWYTDLHTADMPQEEDLAVNPAQEDFDRAWNDLTSKGKMCDAPQRAFTPVGLRDCKLRLSDRH